MSCPLNRNRFAGSGYCKEETNSNKELEDRLKQMMAERTAQDSGVFKPVKAGEVEPQPVGAGSAFTAIKKTQ